MASRDHAPDTCAATPKSAAPDVSCDLCGAAMPIPPGAVVRGHIVGLLVCTLCIEDHLEARAYEQACH